MPVMRNFGPEKRFENTFNFSEAVQNKFPNMNNFPYIIKAGELKECSACIKQKDRSLCTRYSIILKQPGTFLVAEESNYVNLPLI
jgi:hypothetical protein